MSALNNYSTSKDLTKLKELLDQGYKVVCFIAHEHWVEAFVSEKRHLPLTKQIVYTVNRTYNFSCGGTLFEYFQKNNIAFITPNLDNKL